MSSIAGRFILSESWQRKIAQNTGHYGCCTTLTYDVGHAPSPSTRQNFTLLYGKHSNYAILSNPQCQQLDFLLHQIQPRHLHTTTRTNQDLHGPTTKRIVKHILPDAIIIRDSNPMPFNSIPFQPRTNSQPTTRSHDAYSAVRLGPTLRRIARQQPTLPEDHVFSPDATATSHDGTTWESSTASPGMESKDVKPPIASEDCTAAPYVATRLIPHSAAAPSEFTPIITPFKADEWEAAISHLSTDLQLRFQDIPNSIRHGFDMGVGPAIYSTFTPANHQSAIQHPLAVNSHIQKERSLRRYTGPFSRSRLEALIGPFRSSPLGVVEKSGSIDEYRIIQDFSYPRNDPNQPSVNDGIDIDQFHCDWGSFHEIVELVLQANPGTEAATLDVDSAFRCCPIRPSQQPLFVVGWEGFYYLDHNAPFGARSSGGVFGHTADAMVAILASRGIFPTKKWVDNFVFFRSPTTTNGVTKFNFSLNDIYDIASGLGWPWKHSKTRPFATTFKFLGFIWNLDRKTVEIPDDKRVKYISKLEKWTASSRHTRKEAEALHGTLVHCSLAIPDSRSRLPALSRFASKFPIDRPNSAFLTRTPNSSVLSDISWWMDTLASPSFCGSNLTRPPQASDIEIWVDASTSWGVGVVFDGEWETWKFKDGWKKNGRDIGWAEFIAVELGLLTAVARRLSDIHLVMKSDNQGVIAALAGGKSRNPEQNRVLQRTVAIMQEHAIWLSSKYVESKINLADRPSRGYALKGSPRFEKPIRLPNYLTPYIINSRIPTLTENTPLD